MYLGKVTVNIEPPFNKGEIKFYIENNEEIEKERRNITVKKN